jgi:hypothetical protein
MSGCRFANATQLWDKIKSIEDGEKKLTEYICTPYTKKLSQVCHPMVDKFHFLLYEMYTCHEHY